MTRVFSGIQPTGEVHLGNYIGAIAHWVEDQSEADCFYCIVDLHAITVQQDPDELRSKTIDLAAILLAAGIDPKRSTLFVQSHVPAHAQGAWILNCYATFGELRRMTQFKDKAQKQKEAFVSVGLFDYPVLQAADVLLYQADQVPVGEDQRQHLELMRDIATRFNQRHGDTFIVPEATIPKVGARIMDLQSPEAKMSKSADSPQGTLKVTDPPDVVRRKIKTAVTDSGRDVKAAGDKPAITNLLTIFSVASGRAVAELEGEYGDSGYAKFKADLAEALVEYLRPFQERYDEYTADPAEIARALASGAAKAEAVSSRTLATVYEKVGFLPRS